jgi:iron complex transport system permease protein
VSGQGLATAAPAPGSLAAGYAGFVRRRFLLLGLLAVLLLLALLADIATGPAQLSLGTVVSGLIDPDSLPRPIQVILWNVRLPYAIMAVLVGASLGLSGAEMQTVLNNPLASPFTLGVSAAATLGASLVIVMGVGPLGLPQHIAVPIGAFAFAAGASVLVQAMARMRGTGVDTVVLFGIALVFALNAAVALLQFIADAETLQQIVFWGMGSLARATWPKIAVVAIVLAFCLPFSMLGVWKMTALRAGEAQAESLGIDTARLRLVVMLRASLLAATAVAFVGTIGFVGLVGPHMARLLLGEDHRFFLPGAALAGALVLSLASIASKMLVPGLIIPVGIVTSLVGVPLFLALLFGRGRGQ